MLYAFVLVSVLCIIDLLMLLIMPEFYFKIGIPIYNALIELKEGKTIEDVRVFIGLSDKFKYKIQGNIILYRTKFTFLNLYTLAFVSIVKGGFSLDGNKLKIVQRINLSTLYLIGILIYIGITQRLDNFGKGAFLFIIIIIIVFNVLRNNVMREIQSDIESRLGSGASV